MSQFYWVAPGYLHRLALASKDCLEIEREQRGLEREASGQEQGRWS